MSYYDPDNYYQPPEACYFFDWTPSQFDPTRTFIDDGDGWIFYEEYANETDKEEDIDPIIRFAVIRYEEDDEITIAKWFKHHPEWCGYETLIEQKFEDEYGKLKQLQYFCYDNDLYL